MIDRLSIDRKLIGDLLIAKSFTAHQDHLGTLDMLLLAFAALDYLLQNLALALGDWQGTGFLIETGHLILHRGQR